MERWQKYPFSFWVQEETSEPFLCKGSKTLFVKEDFFFFFDTKSTATASLSCSCVCVYNFIYTFIFGYAESSLLCVGFSRVVALCCICIIKTLSFDGSHSSIFLIQPKRWWNSSAAAGRWKGRQVSPGIVSQTLLLRWGDRLFQFAWGLSQPWNWKSYIMRNPTDMDKSGGSVTLSF